MFNRQFRVVVRDIAIGAVSLEFDSRAEQIGHSVANSSPPLRHFFETVLSRRSSAEMGSATRYTPLRVR